MLHNSILAYLSQPVSAWTSDGPRHIFSANISQYFIQNLNLLGLSNYYCVENWFVIIDLDLKWYGSQRIKISFGAGGNSYFLVWWLILLISHINQYKCRYVGNLWKRTAFPKNKRCLCLMKWPFLKYFAESFHQASIHLLFRKKKWCCLSILPRPSFTPKWVDLWVRFIYTHHTMMMGAILVI